MQLVDQGKLDLDTDVNEYTVGETQGNALRPQKPRECNQFLSLFISFFVRPCGSSLIV